MLDNAFHCDRCGRPLPSPEAPPIEVGPGEWQERRVCCACRRSVYDPPCDPSHWCATCPWDGAWREGQVVVVWRDCDGLTMASLVPRDGLPGVKETYDSRQMPNPADLPPGVKPLWLTAQGREDVEESLRVQGEDPERFVIPATTHGPYKARRWQGIILAAAEWDVTHLAAPGKPWPSAREREFYRRDWLEGVER